MVSDHRCNARQAAACDDQLVEAIDHLKVSLESLRRSGFKLGAAYVDYVVKLCDEELQKRR